LALLFHNKIKIFMGSYILSKAGIHFGLKFIILLSSRSGVANLLIAGNLEILLVYGFARRNGWVRVKVLDRALR
jgi:hypothetical protein